MNRAGIQALASALHHFRYHPWEWSNPDHLSLQVDIADEAALRAALDALGLAWPADWTGEPHSYDIDRDCTCDVGRHYLRFAIASQQGPGEGLERSHVETARRIEAALEGAGVLAAGGTVAHLERGFRDRDISGWSPARFHLRVSSHGSGSLHLHCSVASGFDPREGPPMGERFTASMVEETVTELDVPPGQLPVVRRWMLGKNLVQNPWIVVRDLSPTWRAQSYEERLESALALFEQPRLIGIEIGLIQPGSKAGWHPRRPVSQRAAGRSGGLSLVARWTVDDGSVNVLAILAHEDGMTEQEFEARAPRAQEWAAAAARGLGVPCTVPISAEVDPFLRAR